ncbi:alkaline phosphatase family protein [Olivibacter sp. SDN3]|uniref:alkaline phosphatase family protein n=1 Tax=Olivibacter sp. SDN3 TaxID=2764720 RepID=UPI00165112A4|nr:alkaline phosphatase family protein [Olivibacter sp. SDN3]QNL47939.1 alkaline phosphatase family protein [Olivibacter sp. SDN3]
MHIKKSLLLPLMLFSTAILYAQEQRKVVYIIADGISADVIEQAQTPNLREISTQGSYLRVYQGGEAGAYNESPTISAVGYNNILTGVWYNKHNVPDNNIEAPNYHYPSIFRVLKDAYPEKTIGIFSSWQDNRTKLIGEGLPATGNIQMDYAFDGLELDTLRYPHDKERQFMSVIDQAVSENAAKTIQEEGPDLSWVYLEFTDDMGHMHGDSPAYSAAVEKMDAQVGLIWQAIKKRAADTGEDWMIMITTDHGRDEKTGKGHGGQTFRQRSAWLVCNKVLENPYSRYGKPSVVDLYPTIANFLNIEIPKESLWELDGVTLMDDIAIAHPQAYYFQEQLDISWTALDDNGEVNIWISTTNNKKTGGSDHYQHIGAFPLRDKHAVIPVKDYPSDFYKVVLETEKNTVNRWIVNDSH